MVKPRLPGSHRDGETFMDNAPRDRAQQMVPHNMPIKHHGARTATHVHRRAAACALLAAALAAHAQAAEPPPPVSPDVAAARNELGFSYLLGLGAQSVTYREDSQSGVSSKATSTSPLIVSGALYAINRDFLFSLGNEMTFAGGSATENWTATSSTFDGQTLTSRLLQTNGFSLSQSTTSLLAHYRLARDWFLVGGGALHTQTYKRYDFMQGPDHAVSLPTDKTVEESTSEVLANIGVALEPGRVRDEQVHYGLRATLGVPIWSRTDNTQSPGVHFDSTSGFDIGLEGRYSLRVHDGIHVGLWGQWLNSRRSRTMVGELELPNNRTTTLSGGLELLWKL